MLDIWMPELETSVRYWIIALFHADVTSYLHQA